MSRVTKVTVVCIITFAVFVVVLALAGAFDGVGWQGARRSTDSAGKNVSPPDSIARTRQAQFATKLNQAYGALKEKDFREAVIFFREAEALEPRFVQAKLDLAYALSASGDSDAALAVYSQYFMLASTRRAWSDSSSLEGAWKYASLAEALKEDDHESRALHYILANGPTRFGNWSPDISRETTGLRKTKARALAVVAIQKLMVEPSTAMLLLQEATRLESEDPTVLYYLGLTYDRMRNYPAAMLEFERAKRLAPADKEIQDAVAHVYKAKYWAYWPKKPMSPLLKEYIKKGVKGQTWDPVLKKRVETPGDR